MSSHLVVGLNTAGFITSSAVLFDGAVVFAVEEERLVREKRTRRFPSEGIRRGLAFVNADFRDVDAFAAAWNPSINLEAFNLALSGRARHQGELFYSVPNYLFNMAGTLAGGHSLQQLELEDGRSIKVYHVTHHLAHAASFFMSPFDESAILTVDAFGEKHSTMFLRGRDNSMQVLWSQEFPHSLGAFYATFTEYCGFQVQSDEWKLMGASSYGDSNRFYEKVRSLLSLRDDGGFELDLTYFNHYQFHRPGRVTSRLIDHLGLAPNRLNERLSEGHFDLAAAVQRVMEDVYFHLMNSLHERTRSQNIVVAGGVALNSVANGKIGDRTPFTEVFIPPAPDDSGCSMGAALYLYNQIEGNPRRSVLSSTYLGPSYSNDEIETTLKQFGLPYTRLSNTPQTAAELITAGKIIGWFQGRLEFGDRALGNRSILADPRDARMKDKVNATVKYREPFRPFAPSVLSERAGEFFVNPRSTPFMERVAYVREDKRTLIPAVTHVDGTGRLQTVTKQQNPRYWALIEAFGAVTGIPLVLNTSFNLNGEAIVCSPTDAIRTFFTSGLDALVMEDVLVRKR